MALVTPSKLNVSQKLIQEVHTWSAETLDPKDGWKLIIKKNNILLSYKDLPNGRILRGSIELGETAHTILDMIMNNWFQWDSIIEKYRMVKQLDDNTRIVYLQYKEQPHLFNARKMLYIQKWTEIPTTDQEQEPTLALVSNFTSEDELLKAGLIDEAEAKAFSTKDDLGGNTLSFVITPNPQSVTVSYTLSFLSPQIKSNEQLNQFWSDYQMKFLSTLFSATSQEQPEDKKSVKGSFWRDYDKVRKKFNIPADEKLLQDFTCSYLGKLHHSGKLYIFQRHVCFWSLTGYIKESIPFTKVDAIVKEKKLLLKTRIQIKYKNEHNKEAEMWIVSLLQRDTIAAALQSAWEDNL